MLHRLTIWAALLLLASCTGGGNDDDDIDPCAEPGACANDDDVVTDDDDDDWPPDLSGLWALDTEEPLFEIDAAGQTALLLEPSTDPAVIEGWMIWIVPDGLDWREDPLVTDEWMPEAEVSGSVEPDGALHLLIVSPVEGWTFQLDGVLDAQQYLAEGTLLGNRGGPQHQTWGPMPVFLEFLPQP